MEAGITQRKNTPTCRVCLTPSENTVSLLSIDENTLLPLKDMVMALAEVQIVENDGLPSTICQECHELVFKSYQLKLRCEQSDKLLRESKVKCPQNENNHFTFHCGICKETFHEINQLLSHVKDHETQEELLDTITEIESVIIPGCPQEEEESEAQMKPGHNIIKCSICHKWYGKGSDFARHLNAHHNKRGIPQDNLGEEHERVQKKRCICIKCGMMLSDMETLALHEREAHPESKRFQSYMVPPEVPPEVDKEQRPHACTECDKSFKHKYSLKLHLLHHSGERKLLCKICGKKYYNPPEFNKHMRIHSGDTYQCHLCGRVCTTSSNLKKHISAVHEGRKTNFCTMCPKGFPSKAELTSHIRSHTGEKPFACKYCPRKFASKTKMKQHSRIHTEKDPFKCGVCNIVFRAYSTFKLHQRRMHHTDNKDVS